MATPARPSSELDRPTDAGEARRRRGDLAWFFGLALVWLLLDLLSKTWAEGQLLLDAPRPGIGFLHWRLVHNRGVAFGFLATSDARSLSLLALLGAGLLVAYVVVGSAKRGLLAAGLGMVLGGTLGNVVDRVLHGAVTDFAVVPFWPAVFNVADVGIRAGILLTLLALFWPRRKAPLRM